MRSSILGVPALAGLLLFFVLDAAPARAQGVGSLMSQQVTNVDMCTNLTVTSTLCREAHLIGLKTYNTPNASTVFIMGSTNLTNGGIPLTTGGVYVLRGGPMGIDLSTIYYRVQDTNDLVTVVYQK